VFGLVIMVCLSINNPNEECIVVPFINNVWFVMYVITQSFYWFFVVKNNLG
jgi:hypothetical protein